LKFLVLNYKLDNKKWWKKWNNRQLVKPHK
jgi:hypothetical protein